ncbi:hypothetical protein STEG23_014223, partial [Scotinomys teguina]
GENVAKEHSLFTLRTVLANLTVTSFFGTEVAGLTLEMRIKCCILTSGQARDIPNISEGLVWEPTFKFLVLYPTGLHKEDDWTMGLSAGLELQVHVTMPNFLYEHWDPNFLYEHWDPNFLYEHWDSNFLYEHWDPNFLYEHWDPNFLYEHWDPNFLYEHWDPDFLYEHWDPDFLYEHWDPDFLYEHWDPDFLYEHWDPDFLYEHWVSLYMSLGPRLLYEHWDSKLRSSCLHNHFTNLPNLNSVFL